MTARTIDAPLTWESVGAVAAGATLVVSDEALARIAQAKAIVSVIVDRRVTAYGVNTGVGALSEIPVDESLQSTLSRNIIMSHACGVGAPLPVSATRAVMACAINNFAHGHSGVRPLVVQTLVNLLNANLIPVVPRAGSIGYLTHMAHIALALLGGGSVHSSEGVLSGEQALERLGTVALVLQAKEGLSLVNGTPCATGFGCWGLHRLHSLLDWADVAAAMTFENIGTQPSAIGGIALKFRQSQGIAASGARLAKLLQGSEILAQARTHTQDALSLRALPQVHGAVRDSVDSTALVVNRELASVTDNPIISGTTEDPRVYSQAHAVGSALALAMDGIAVAVAKLAATSERRIDRLVNPLVSGLPAFLARHAGVSSGFMIAQYTALSLASQNRRLAAPVSLDGGVSSALQEDEISHATPSALRVLDIVDNLETILAIELLTAAQAYEFQNPKLRRAPATESVHRALRERVPVYDDDRPLADDIAATVDFMRQTAPP